MSIERLKTLYAEALEQARHAENYPETWQVTAAIHAKIKELASDADYARSIRDLRLDLASEIRSFRIESFSELNPVALLALSILVHNHPEAVMAWLATKPHAKRML